VVDPGGKLVGVVSQTDLLAWHFAAGVDGTPPYDSGVEDPPSGLRVADVRSARVDEVMSPVVHCICPDQTLALAAARMIDRQVHRLIVVDQDGRVLGVLSATDLLHALPGVDEALALAREERALYSDRMPA
jgi:CBS-domain-containing membrane protein